ncbi:MAG: tRNA 5-methoxyuridine(34)/uridine 5-oxyacetic acid(34) synthase CmoB [Gammaproteobacteria bacterium]|nr:tRNA 5-methoxyuridine(34)/uridine 5-oxyacetic acid(34) synthase CmoB [Gammaproteobacteria bacterium]
MMFRDWLESSWRTAGFPIDTTQLIHGKLEDWMAALDRLPNVQPSRTHFGDTLQVGTSENLTTDEREILDDVIDSLKPWRKGPLNLFGREIDAEWRSDFKWNRLGSHIQWQEKRVLDVGSGNGYFGFRAVDAGASSVLGVDGYLLYVLQAALVNWFVQSSNVVVPLRFNRDSIRDEFDIVLSMGVIYHQRDADSHLEELFRRCRRGGQVILESIVADEDFVPENRYAGMRNVYLIPSICTLETKLRTIGFSDPILIDVTKTTIKEQRKTQLMPFQSLTDALDPADTSLTIEGLPAPKRAILIAHRAD